MKKRGFTLAELLIVIALMAIMATVALSSFTKSQKKGRDARRKQDLSEIKKALEIYYQDNFKYPDGFSSGGSLSHPTIEGVVYMVKIPSDPKTGLKYYYEPVDLRQGFRLYAHVEYEIDSNYSGGGGDCGAKSCNFVVTSPGTALP